MKILYKRDAYLTKVFFSIFINLAVETWEEKLHGLATSKVLKYDLYSKSYIYIKLYRIKFFTVTVPRELYNG